MNKKTDSVELDAPIAKECDNLIGEIESHEVKRTEPIKVNTEHKDKNGNKIKFFVRMLHKKKQSKPGEKFLVCKVKTGNQKIEYSMSFPIEQLKDNLTLCKSFMWKKIREQETSNK